MKTQTMKRLLFYFKNTNQVIFLNTKKTPQFFKSRFYE